MAYPVTLLRLPPVPFRPSTDDVATMSTVKKFEEAIRRGADRVPENLKGAVLNLVSPVNVAITAGTLSAWAISHFFGVGEVIDLLLLGFGIGMTGLGVYDAAKDFVDFAMTARDARCQSDLDKAADYFARSITTETIVIISAWLLGKQSPTVWRNTKSFAKNLPNIKPRLANPGTPPAPGAPKITWRPEFPAGGGQTTWYGEIRISTKGSMTQELLAYYHEQAHAFLSPRLGPLRDLRAGLKASAYTRSALLRYLEEMLCEMYSQFRVFGVSIDTFKAAYTFPVGENAYVTLSQLSIEGTVVGSIVVESQLFQVFAWEKKQQIPASLGPNYDRMVCE